MRFALGQPVAFTDTVAKRRHGDHITYPSAGLPTTRGAGAGERIDLGVVVGHRTLVDREITRHAEYDDIGGSLGTWTEPSVVADTARTAWLVAYALHRAPVLVLDTELEPTHVAVATVDARFQLGQAIDFDAVLIKVRSHDQQLTTYERKAPAKLWDVPGGRRPSNGVIVGRRTISDHRGGRTWEDGPDDSLFNFGLRGGGASIDCARVPGTLRNAWIVSHGLRNKHILVPDLDARPREEIADAA